MVRDVWQFLDFHKLCDFYAKCTYVHNASQVFVQKQCANKETEKKEWKKKEIANGRISRDK
jgi:hypothetical protein